MVKIERGEIYYADLRPVVGSEQDGIRPVLILQNGAGNAHSRTYLCAPLTTKRKAYMPTHVGLIGRKCGMKQDSIVMLEQIRVLDIERFRNRVGKLDEAMMERVDRALSISLGLQRNDGGREMNELQVTEYKDVRVLTTQQLAEAYGTESKVISNNFNNNKTRYAEGKHFICLTGEELREFLHSSKLGLQNESKIRVMYFWTEKGAFLHAKSLNTDKAWEVYEHLVDTYFNRKETVPVPMTIPEQIQLLAKGNLQLEQRVDSIQKDLQDFKQDLPLLAVECQKITRAKNQKVVPLMGGKESPAYRNNSLRGKVYSDIDSQLRREFGVDTYKAIKRSQCDIAVAIISGYTLPMVLEEQIKEANMQGGEK